MTKELLLEKNHEITQLIRTIILLYDLKSGEIIQIIGKRKIKWKIDLDETNNFFDFQSILSDNKLGNNDIFKTVQIKLKNIFDELEEGFQVQRIMMSLFQLNETNSEFFLIEFALYGMRDNHDTIREFYLIFDTERYNKPNKIIIKWKMDPPDLFGYISEQEKLILNIKNSFNFAVEKGRVFHFEYKDIFLVKIKTLSSNIGLLKGNYDSDSLKLIYNILVTNSRFFSHSIEYEFFPSIIEFNLPGLTLGIFPTSELKETIMHMCCRTNLADDDSIQTLDERFTGKSRVNIGTFYNNLSDYFIERRMHLFKEIYISPNIDNSTTAELSRLIPKTSKIIRSFSESHFIPDQYDVALILPSNFSYNDKILLCQSASFIHFLHAKFLFNSDDLILKIQNASKKSLIRNKIVYSLVKNTDKHRKMLSILKDCGYIVINLRISEKKSQKRIFTRFIVERTFASFLNKYLPKNLNGFNKEKYSANNPLHYAIKLLEDTNLWKDTLVFLNVDKKNSRREFVKFCNKVENFLEQGNISLLDISKFWALVQILFNLTSIPFTYTYLEKLNSWTIIDENLPDEYLVSAVNHSIFYSSPLLKINIISTGFISEIAKKSYEMIKNSETSELTDYFNLLSIDMSKRLFEVDVKDFFIEITHFLPFVRLLNHIYNKPLKRNDDLMSKGILSLYSKQKEILLEIGFGLEINSQVGFGRCLVGSPKDTFDLTFSGFIYPLERYNPTKFGFLHKIIDIKNLEDVIYFINESLRKIEDVEVIELIPEDQKSDNLQKFIRSIFSMNFSIILSHGNPGIIYFQTTDGTISSNSTKIQKLKKELRNPIIYLNSCFSAKTKEEDSNTLSIAEAFSILGAKVVIAPISLINLRESLPSQIDFIRYLSTGQPLSCITRKVRHYRLNNLYDTNFTPFILIGDPHIRFYKNTISEQKRIRNEIKELLKFPGPKGSWISQDLK